MKGLNFSMAWLGSNRYRNAAFVMSAVVGFAMLSPWWRHSWQAWDEANAVEATLRVQQASTQVLQVQTAQWLQSQYPSPPSLADVSVLHQLAQQQGLQLAHVGLDKPLHSAALNALQIQQLPVHANVQGSWQSWLNWLAQWPSAAPGVTVASLDIKADPRGGVVAHVVALTPQSTANPMASKPSHVNVEGSMPPDPFNATDWTRMQRTHVAQHPSYARLVAPELLRPRDLLESFPRERLQYVGQIASHSAVEALVKVLPATVAKKEPQMMSVHRVRVGSHLGHDFGKVLAVASDHLVVQELALMPTGEWQTRVVRLTLQEATP